VNRTPIECRLISSGESGFAHCAKIRLEVFVDEQGVPPELEMDELDAEAVHVLATVEGDPVGTGRLVLLEDGNARIGRMAVLRAQRSQGVGSAVLTALVEQARQRGVCTAVLAAQLHAIPFYERGGFTAYGEEFEEAGILHRMMSKQIG
jgi:predicted GNAT family N-acyltransferase